MLTTVNFKEKIKQFTKKAVSISLSALLTISTLGINYVYAGDLDQAIADINGLKVPSESRTDMGTKAYSFGWVLDVPDKKAITDFRGTTIKFSNPAMILFSKTVYATNMSVQDNL